MFVLFVATVYIYVNYTYTYIRIFFIDDTFSMIAIFEGRIKNQNKQGFYIKLIRFFAVDSAVRRKRVEVCDP